LKIVLFCNLPYAFSILKPLEREAIARGFELLWFVPKEIEAAFTYKQSPYTTDMKQVAAFQSDAIFVPGNEVPYYLRGVKVQVFHGFAGEKKGHFRIRDYFDLYLTQGPYFTERFNQLKAKHNNFEVVETGWCKLDDLYNRVAELQSEKERVLKQSGAEKLVLFAPTFSPSLTSARELQEKILQFSNDERILLHVKFHDKMDAEVIKSYEAMAHKKLVIVKASDITDALVMADVMISDTSSVVYEFIQLDKPVVTLKSTSANINWADAKNADEVQQHLYEALFGKDQFKAQRAKVIAMYHPYHDAKSASRMIDAVEDYIKEHGVPAKRALSLLRKYKIIKQYGRG
jgi:hypothetical protein